jgi:hypothetical protein
VKSIHHGVVWLVTSLLSHTYRVLFVVDEVFGKGVHHELLDFGLHVGCAERGKATVLLAEVVYSG